VRENTIEQWLFKTGSVVINTAGVNRAEVVIDRVENHIT
jgi:hypothetical protein